MRELLPETFDLVLEFNRAVNLQQIHDILIRRAAPFGVRQTMAAIIPKQIVKPEEQAGYVVFGGWPGEWVERYFKRQYVRYDPTLRHCISSDEPEYWSELSTERTVYPVRRVMDEAREFQLMDGITIPQATLDGHRVAVSFAGERIDRSPRAKTVMTILASFAVSRALQLRAVHDLDEAGLTARDIECLSWVAEGKTTVDVAEIMGVSVKAIEKHLAAARLRLGVLSTAAAIAQAMKRGLIS